MVNKLHDIVGLNQTFHEEKFKFFWCLKYTEPSSGEDLYSLQMVSCI